jgi:hypothetical protein
LRGLLKGTLARALGLGHCAENLVLSPQEITREQARWIRHMASKLVPPVAVACQAALCVSLSAIKTNSPGLVADRFGGRFGSKEMARREYQNRTNKRK